MRKGKILLAMVFGSMVAITGCGDDGGGGGTGGSGGSNGSASSSCEAICNGTCLFGGVNPDAGTCLSECRSNAPELDDNCGSQMGSYLSCLEGNDCSVTSLNCLSQAQAWATCNGG